MLQLYYTTTYLADSNKLAMGRGLYSKENINDLYKNHLKFLIATKLSFKFVKIELDKVRDTIRTWTTIAISMTYMLTQKVNLIRATP